MTPRELFDEMNRICEEVLGVPWDGTYEHQTAAILRQREVTEILERHADWLADIRTRVLDSGRDWNTKTCSAQARRDGDLAAPPAWVVDLSTELTPDELLHQ